MNTNHVICRNEVYIEGEYVGEFETFEYQAGSRTLGNTATMTMPLYAIGSDGTSGRASARIRKIFQTDKGSIVRVCSQVEVYVWYESWNAINMAHEAFDKIVVFSGFIEHIAEGFPATIYLQDNSFILRFGAIEKAWDEDATLQKIVEDCIPIANEGFAEERKRLKFTREITKLRYSDTETNVQAITSPLSFRNWGGRSPHDTIQKLMQLMVMYGGVSSSFNVFIGIGVTDSNRPIIKLDTRYNVIERNIIPIDGRFVDYDVKVTGILKSGNAYTATGGYRTSKSASEKSEFEKEYGGETVRGHCTLNDVNGIQQYADQMLKMLRENRNKGTIQLLLYPKIEIMDWVEYTDTVFETLSGGYYVLGYKFHASEKGYYQTIDVSDKVFVL